MAADHSPKRTIAAARLAAAKALLLTVLATAYLAGAAEAQCCGQPPPQCGVQASGSVCSDGRCCSQYGYCGVGPDFCGLGCQSQCSGTSPSATPECGVQAGGVVCPNSLCCSQFGFCGLGAEYCSVGCQSQCSGH